MTQITITPKNLPNQCKYPLTADDGVLSAMAIIANQWEFNEVLDHSIDYLSDQIEYVFNGLDHEMLFIDALNTSKDHSMASWQVINKHTCELLKGACLALHFPQLFDERLSSWVERQKNLINDGLGDYSSCHPLISDKLQEAYNELIQFIYNEYLKGDRSNAGVLYAIKKYYGADGIEYNQNKDELTLLWAEKDELIEYLQLDNDSRYTKKEILEEFLQDVANDANRTLNIREAKKAMRIKEQKRLREYKESQKQAEQKARKEKLLGMTK